MSDLKTLTLTDKVSVEYTSTITRNRPLVLTYQQRDGAYREIMLNAQAEAGLLTLLLSRDAGKADA